MDQLEEVKNIHIANFYMYTYPFLFEFRISCIAIFIHIFPSYVICSNENKCYVYIPIECQKKKVIYHRCNTPHVYLPSNVDISCSTTSTEL